MKKIIITIVFILFSLYSFSQEYDDLYYSSSDRIEYNTQEYQSNTPKTTINFSVSFGWSYYSPYSYWWYYPYRYYWWYHPFAWYYTPYYYPYYGWYYSYWSYPYYSWYYPYYGCHYNYHTATYTTYGRRTNIRSTTVPHVEKTQRTSSINTTNQSRSMYRMNDTKNVRPTRYDSRRNYNDRSSRYSTKESYYNRNAVKQEHKYVPRTTKSRTYRNTYVPKRTINRDRIYNYKTTSPSRSTYRAPTRSTWTPSRSTSPSRSTYRPQTPTRNYVPSRSGFNRRQ